MTLFQDESAGEMVLAPEFNALANTDMSGDLAGGVGGNYAIVSMKGGKWRIKHQGAETLVTMANGDPKPSLEAVIVKANGHLTKQYYEGAYTEGDSAPPRCFSMDGKVPAPSVQDPIHHSCAVCPMNAFGSRITENASKAKACADNRKLAIVPLHDLHNEAFSGPMLFRVPPSALKDLAQFGQLMQSRGFPYNAVAVRIGFDTEVSHPKPTFRAIRPLNSEEAAVVMELYNSDLVERVLADFGPAAQATAPAADEAFEEPQPTPAAVKPVPAPPPAAKPAAAKPVVAQPKAPSPAPVKPAVVKPVATKVPGPPPASKKVVASTPAAEPAPIIDAEIVAPASEAGSETEGTDAAPAEPGGIDDEINNILAGLNDIA